MGIIERIARTEYVRLAIAEKADLSAFKANPSFRIKLGVVIVFFSYVIGWPAIFVLGYVAVATDRTWLAAVVAPLLYGFSHLLFLLGMYLAGANYIKVLMRWTTRVVMEKWLPDHPDKT
jgi:hypothetical protein